MYAHRWTDPSIVRLEPTGIWTVRQECFDCGTTRNPITGQILRRRSGCWVDHQVEVPQNVGNLDRIRERLRQLRETGEAVNAYHPKGDQLELVTP